jgi:hypothetical protein
LPPAIAGLLGDPIVPARHRGGLSIRNRNLDLPQQTHDLERISLLYTPARPCLIRTSISCRDSFHFMPSRDASFRLSNSSKKFEVFFDCFAR